MLISQKLQKFKRNHDSSWKFTVFSMAFNDFWSNFKAISVIIKVLTTQNLQNSKMSFINLFKSLQCSLSYLVTLKLIIKQLGPF